MVRVDDARPRNTDAGVAVRLAFSILGTPVPKGRPLASKRGRFIRMRTPEKTREFEADVALHSAIRAIEQRWPRAYAGLCEVRLTFVCPRPENRHRKVDPETRMWRETGRSDADNHAKSVIDGMQTGGVFKNDNQVVRLVVELHWCAADEAPCVEVEVLTLDDALFCDLNQVEAKRERPARQSGAFR